MNSVKDIVKLLVSYPDHDSVLAKVPHMYVCIYASAETRLLKCQSQKPYHLKPGSMPQQRFVVETNATVKLFRVTTIIDLDKVFVASAPTSYPVIGKLPDDLFKKLIAAFDYANAEKINL